jgi:hypothetical protein
MVNSGLSEKILSKVDIFYYLHNTISSNYIKKILKEDKNGILLFKPESNWANVMQIYQKVGKLI